MRKLNKQPLPHNIEEYIKHISSSNSQNYFMNSNISIKNILISTLKKETNKMCAYCEQSIEEGGDIEHIKPKSLYPQLANKWNNLTVTCRECNVRKSSRELPINPFKDDPADHLKFDMDGHVIPLTQSGADTIAILSLNRENLVYARELKIQYVISIIKNEHYLPSSQDSFLGCIKQLFNNKLEEIRSTSNIMLESHNNNNLYPTLNNSNIDIYIDTIIKKNKKIKNKYKNLDDLNLDIHNIENIKKYRKKKILIENINIKNFKGIENINIKFNNLFEKETVPSLIILGENGSGKSTILQAIVYALLGKESFKEEKNKLLTGSYLRKTNLLKKVKNAEVHLKLTDIKKTIHLNINKSTAKLRTSGRKVPVLAYGSIRLLSNNKKSKNKFTGLNIKNLFNCRYELINAEKWLLSLDNKIFKVVSRKVLHDLLLLNSNEKIIRNKKEILIAPQNIPISMWSDGYKSVLSLVCDILANMQILWKEEIRSINDYTGVVLIDEIEQHLHPKWKFEIYPRLKKIFPQIQFIITTHDPLCIQNADDGEVHIIKKDNQNNVSIVQLNVPKGKYIDQVLTGDWFSLNSTLDNSTYELFKKYQEILLTDKNNTEINKLQDELNNRLGVYADKTFWGIYQEVIREEELNYKVTFTQDEKDLLKIKLQKLLKSKK